MTSTKTSGARKCFWIESILPPNSTSKKNSLDYLATQSFWASGTLLWIARDPLRGAGPSESLSALEEGGRISELMTRSSSRPRMMASTLCPIRLPWRLTTMRTGRSSPSTSRRTCPPPTTLMTLNTRPAMIESSFSATTWSPPLGRSCRLSSLTASLTRRPDSSTLTVPISLW